MYSVHSVRSEVAILVWRLHGAIATNQNDGGRTIRKNKDKIFTFMSSERGLVTDEFVPPEIENVGARAALALRIALLSVIHSIQQQACRKIFGYKYNAEYATVYESTTMYA